MTNDMFSDRPLLQRSLHSFPLEARVAALSERVSPATALPRCALLGAVLRSGLADRAGLGNRPWFGADGSSHELAVEQTRSGQCYVRASPGAVRRLCRGIPGRTD